MVVFSTKLSVWCRERKTVCLLSVPNPAAAPVISIKHCSELDIPKCIMCWEIGICSHNNASEWSLFRGGPVYSRYCSRRDELIWYLLWLMMKDSAAWISQLPQAMVLCSFPIFTILQLPRAITASRCCMEDALYDLSEASFSRTGTTYSGIPS